MPPAIIAGGIAAAGTIGGALISSGSQSSAANQAAQQQQQATNAQLQLGQESLGLNRDIYNSNYATLSPFVSRGNVAGDNINALLGLPTAPTMTSPLAQPASSAPGQTAPGGGYSGPSLQQIQAMQHDGIPGNYHPALNAYNAAHQQGVQTAPVVSQTPVPVPGAAPPAATPAATSAASPTQALNNFANSAGMQFQQQQGANAINNLYAAHGQLQSGAAEKAISDRAQQIALQNYFMPYLSLLSGQQSVGAQGASAIAGVGSNFGNTAAGINSSMAGTIQNGADNQSNAALARGLAGANLGAGIASGIGSLASSFIQPGASSVSSPGYPININGGTNAYFASHPFGGVG